MRELGVPFALVLAVALLSGPVSGTVLLAVPLGLLLGAATGRFWPAVAGAALLGLVFAGTLLEWTGGSLFGLAEGLPLAPPEGLGRAERGWALLAGAWLLVLTAVAPRWGILRRALAATFATAASAAGILAVSGGWPPLETVLDRRLQRGVAAAGSLLRRGGGEIATRDAADAVLLDAARLQSLIYPALLALATLAALGLAAGLATRARGRRGFGAVRDFRFGDGWVWLLLGGLAVVALPLGAVASRMGANLLAFMAGLYALRGVAVVVALWAGASPLVWVAGGVIAVLLYPLAVPATVVIGLGDTWLDLRARAKAARANEE